MVTISTLQDDLDYGYSLRAHCSSGHSVVLDIPKLIEKLGPDFKISENRDRFLRMLKCSKCGEPAMTVQLTPINAPGMGR